MAERPASDRPRGCDYCGADDADWDYGPDDRRVWVCGSAKCHRELRRDCQDAYEAEREAALGEVDARWGR